MNATQPRTPAGSPDGGQFTGTVGMEAAFLPFDHAPAAAAVTAVTSPASRHRSGSQVFFAATGVAAAASCVAATAAGAIAGSLVVSAAAAVMGAAAVMLFVNSRS